MFKKTKPQGPVIRIIVIVLIVLMLVWSFYYAMVP